MGFLAPALLLLGAAVSVPLILHLFQRHQGPRVVFPALRYLRRAEKEHARSIRLRQLLLMLLRIGVLILLALAAARPFLRAAGTGHEPTAVAIVLDNSMSSGLVVGDRRVLDELKDRALETLAGSGPEDRFWLIRAGLAWEPALPGDAETTARRVRETEPSAARADIGQAVAHARAILDAGAAPLAREVQLLTDLQATGFSAPPAAEQTGAPLVIWSRDQNPPPNLTVAAVAVGGGVPPTAGQRSIVTARLAGTALAESTVVRLAIDGRVVAVATASPGAAAVLPFPPRTAGVVTGWVESNADPLRADDRRFFALRVRPQPAVATGARLALADEALAVMETAGRIRRGPLDNADVALLPAAAGLEAVPPGRSVVVIAPDSVLDVPAANRRLTAGGIPWRFEPGQQTGEARFDTTAERDEIMRTLAAVRVRRAFLLAPQPGAGSDTTLLRLSDGQAWAVRGNRRGGGSYILIASPLTESATTLPTSAAMLPLLDRVITTWAVIDVAPSEFAPGAEIALPTDVNVVERPDGVIEPVEPGSTYRLGADAGVYRLRDRDSVRAALAVNPPPEESDLTRIEQRQLRLAFPGWRLYITTRADEWADTIYRGRVGREIWRPFLLAALALLLLEAVIAAAGSTRRRGTNARSPIQRGAPGDTPQPAPTRGH